MLHIVSLAKLSPELIGRIGSGDDLLLQNGSICAAKSGHKDNELLLNLMAKSCHIYILQAKLTAFGLSLTDLLPDILLIDYAGMVTLTENNSVIHTWC